MERKKVQDQLTRSMAKPQKSSLDELCRYIKKYEGVVGYSEGKNDLEQEEVGDPC